MQHQPADGDVAVPQTVEQLRDVVQDDLLAQEALLQQLLHLGLQDLHAVCVAARLEPIRQRSEGCLHQVTYPRLKHMLK